MGDACEDMGGQGRKTVQTNVAGIVETQPSLRSYQYSAFSNVDNLIKPKMPGLTKPSNSKKRIMQSGIGFTSGLIVSTIFQPLEVFKMAIILSPRINGNILEKMKGYSNIVLKQHGVKGFWNGLTPAILRSSIGNILYFIPLRIFQEKFMLSPFIASALARTVGCIAINPLTVLETRFCMPGPRQHKNIFSAVKTLYQNEGSKAFWKGTLPSCIKDGLFAGIYYQLYKTTKNDFFGYQALDNFISGLFSGCCATVISHPFEIVRAKVQSGHHAICSKLPSVLKKIYQQDGVAGFMKGVTPRLARKPLINATTFMVFETIEKFVFEHCSFGKF